MVQVPSGILALDQRLTGGRGTAWCARFGHTFMYGRHPTVLVFFLVLLVVGEFLFLPGAWPRLSTFHKVLGVISIVLPYWYLYLAAYSDPGVITPATLSKYMSQYPYDFTLFHPGHVCRTCNIIKPPRSKHCAVCNRCVAKMDHHCVFINTCVGYENHGYFMLLLLSTAWLTTYGALLGMSLISGTIRERHPGWRLWKPSTFSWHDYLILLTFGIQDDVGVGSVTMLALLVSPLVWGLLGYHIYLVYCGTTTNESMKWQDWKAEMEDGYAFKRMMPPDRVKYPEWEANWTRWPAEAIQVLVRTEDGSLPATEDAPGTGEWERVWSLREVENLYDLGFWDNLVDVFSPGHSFRDEVVSDAERSRRSSKPKETRASAVVNVAT
jgi:palmitoyltransferase ZDHHC4